MGSDWLCFVTKTLVPDHKTLTNIRAEFTRLVDEHGGEYDGWGTPVEK
jgi:hypothetical protein